MPQTKPFLSVRSLSHTYHTNSGETPALRDIHFDLFPGEFAAIVGPSGCGKTTLLRELIRVISQRGIRVSVLDERCELSASGSFDLGRCSDVLSGVPKELGTSMLLRGMNPQVIAMDEISREEDRKVIDQILGCGVSILASAHGRDRQDMLKRPMYRSFFDMGVFKNILTIYRDGDKRRYLLEKV